jgi:4-amino-4-deoxy-L-arabinose transferase-like glycosyltransferase
MLDRAPGPQKALFVFIGLLSGYRLGVIGTIPLTPDEAYYWAWSRRLAVCYYDQPGMVAWVNRLFSLPFDRPTVFTIRLCAVFLSALTTIIVFHAYRHYRDDEKEAAVFAAIFLLLPFSWSYGIMMIHDTVLMPWLALACLFLMRLARFDGRTGDWLFFGIALTGAMYAKFSAVMLAWGLLAYMLWSPKGRRWWRAWAPYAAGALAIALYLPIILWNYQHDWISVQAVQDLTDAEGIAVSGRLKYMARYVLGQIGIFSPLLGVLVFTVLFKGVRDAYLNPSDDRVVLPVCLSLPVFLYFFQQSTRSHVYGNWPNIAFIPLSMLAMSELSIFFRPAGDDGGLYRRLVRAFVVTGLALNLIALVFITLHLQYRIFRPALERLEEWKGLDKRVDWRVDLDFGGWDEMAELVEESRGGADFILARRYQVAGMLEFMLPGRPFVECYNRGRRGNQWDLWSRLSEKSGQTALFVNVKKMHPTVRERFDEVEPVAAPFVLGDPKRPIKRFYIYKCYGWKGRE